jgi:hypothetical protein
VGGSPTKDVRGYTMFATHHGDAFLVAAQNDYDFLDVSLVSLTGGAPTVQSWTWPCSFLPAGFDPYPAEAVPFGDGFLVATSNLFSDTDPGCPAPSLTVLHRVRAGESPVLLGSVAGYPVAVAPHPEGLWMAWPEQQSNAPPHLDVLRVEGETGAVVVAKTFADVDAGSVAVAAMDRSLALVWTSNVMSQEPAPPEVHLRVLTESGDTLGEAVLHDVDAPWRISVVASPDARSVVVAWGQWASAGRISVARADCTGGS